MTFKGSRGSVLGLAVTKRIVEEHRGTLRVESSSSGTIFTMTLPIDSGADPSATAANASTNTPKLDDLTLP